MTTPLTRVGAITLFVDDVARSKAWYANVFQCPVVFEDAESTMFDFGNTIINLLRVPAATGLVAPAPVATPTSGASAQMTIFVDDVDTICTELARRGVVLLNGPMDREWGQRTACIADPDGHVWELAHPLPRPETA